MLANASLAVQRALGVAAEPLLLPPGPAELVRAAADAALVVAGLSDRWAKEGLGAVRGALAPADDVRMIRFKISAGDLPSAESILEVHRAEKGEDAEYLLGLAWVARGAALTGDWKAASRHARA